MLKENDGINKISRQNLRICGKLFIMIILGASGTVSGKNLVYNGDFSIEKNGKPSGWACSDDLEYDKSEGCVTFRNPAGQKPVPMSKLSRTAKKISPAEQYRLSVKLKTANLTCRKVYLVLYNKGWTKSVGIYKFPADTAGKWQEISANVVAPPSTGAYRVGIFLMDWNGEISVKDVSLTAFGKAAEYTAKASLDKKDGFYKSGETAVCTVDFFENGKPYNGKIRSVIKWEDEEIESKVLEYKGTPLVVKKTVTQPGWLYFGFKIVDEAGNDLKGKNVYKHVKKPDIVEDIGALFDADKIKPLAARPADFDAYWEKCRQELDKIPFNVQRKELEVPEKYKGKVALYAVTLDIIENGKATGYLAVPVNAKAKSCPAFVSFLSWSWCDAPAKIALASAAKGSLAFSASWHGLPVGEKSAYYKAQGKKFQSMSGVDNREKWIMRNIYFRVLRELDYVKSLPEWNGKNLAVSGGSLGGIQAIAAAALDPAVTLAIVSVPAFCEFDTQGKRSFSIPLYHYKNEITPEQLQCTSYYAGVNFAPRVNCEIYCCTGFVDTTCPPSNVMAFYNALPEGIVKSMSTAPGTGHFGTTKNIRGDKRIGKYFENAVVQRYGKDEQMK